MNVKKRYYWIFDMDGTLTVAIHNFAEIRMHLGLPPDKPILEIIETLPAEKAQEITEKLQAIEHTLAYKAEPQPGVYDLLKALQTQKKKRGIVTRNNLETTNTTLINCNIHQYFNTSSIICREVCKPKPSPEGILELLKLWNAPPWESVIVGDYLFDLQAGRQAGIGTIYLDNTNQFRWKNYADLCISHLSELTKILKYP